MKQRIQRFVNPMSFDAVVLDNDLSIVDHMSYEVAVTP